MNETTNNSSLPLLLSITGAVVIVAVGGWFYLEQSDSAGTSPVQPLSAETVPVEQLTEATAVDEPDDELPQPDAGVDVDAELRKARLAAGADILVFPQGQSALHYYGQVLAADPGHALAIAELDAVLATVARTVSEQLAAESYNDAYSIAVQVAGVRPEHALVMEVQQTLDAITEERVAQAIELAQQGNDDEAEQLVVAVESLPGRNPDYIVAVRESIEEIRGVRLAAERDRTARAQLAANEAKAAWVDRINSAISAGNLIAPVGACARDLLDEQNNWAAERAAMTEELVAALGSTAGSHIDADRLDDAEVLLDAAVELTGDEEQFAELRSSLEQAFVDAESSKVKALADLVRIKTVPARYPNRAERRNISGWVDVLFTVTPTGTTSDIEIRGAEPDVVFNRAAIEAVEQWVFEPVEFRGQVISQRAGARLSFKLE